MTNRRWIGILVAALLGGVVALTADRLVSRAPRATEPPAPPAAPPAPAPTPVNPGAARALVIDAVTAAGVPVAAIEHGLYPLRGPGRAPGDTLPLVSFPCPAGRDCSGLLDGLSSSAKSAGFKVVRSDADDRPGRPIYRAIVVGTRPALAVRALPSGPRLTLVINDVGREPALLDLLVALDEHVTYAVMANAPHAPEVAERLGTLGREVIAHLPMEPSPPKRPDGADFLLGHQSPAEIAAATAALLDRVPGAVGANNHMGSALTASRPHMAALLGVLKKRALFFVDDRTSPASVAETTARALGVRTAARTHFLDVPGQDLLTRLRAIENILVIDGQAIVVAHPKPATLRALQPWLADLSRRGIRLLRLSEIVL